MHGGGKPAPDRSLETGLKPVLLQLKLNFFKDPDTGLAGYQNGKKFFKFGLKRQVQDSPL